MCTPLQEAAAVGFENKEELNKYFQNLRSDLQKKRDKLAKVLNEIGFKVHLSSGSYFLLADFSSLLQKCEKFFTSEDKCDTVTSYPLDFIFSKFLVRQVGVGVIPGLFYLFILFIYFIFYFFIYFFIF